MNPIRIGSKLWLEPNLILGCGKPISACIRCLALKSERGTPSRDNIPAIDDPKFTTTVLAGDWIKDLEPIISLEINGEAKAYPLQILTWHEIVNDTLGGEPVLGNVLPPLQLGFGF